MIWKITIHSKTGEQLKRFPEKDIKLIESVFFQLETNPEDVSTDVEFFMNYL